MTLYIWIVVLMAGTCAGAEKLLSAEVVEDATNYTNTTNGLAFVRTTNFAAPCTLSYVLTTNVSERWPAHCQRVPCPDGREGCAVLHWGPPIPDSNPTNKWIRTAITRQTYVDFTVDGTPFRGLLKEETLFDKEVEWVLHRQDEWNEK